MEQNKVLDYTQVQLKLDRMAYELAEKICDTPKVVLMGIAGGGFPLAEFLTQQLETILQRSFKLSSIIIDKKNPLNGGIRIEGDAQELDAETTVILIDDVLESGKTMAYAASHILQFPIERLITCVLVNRKHLKFPIRTDVVGLSLSTTLHDNIEVEWKQNKAEVYLR